MATVTLQEKNHVSYTFLEKEQGEVGYSSELSGEEGVTSSREGFCLDMFTGLDKPSRCLSAYVCTCLHFSVQHGSLLMVASTGVQSLTLHRKICSGN